MDLWEILLSAWKKERRESKEEKIDNLVLFSILYNVLFLDSKGTAASAKLSGANP